MGKKEAGQLQSSRWDLLGQTRTAGGKYWLVAGAGHQHQVKPVLFGTESGSLLCNPKQTRTGSAQAGRRAEEAWLSPGNARHRQRRRPGRVTVTDSLHSRSDLEEQEDF